MVRRNFYLKTLVKGDIHLSNHGSMVKGNTCTYYLSNLGELRGNIYLANPGEAKSTWLTLVRGNIYLNNPGEGKQ